jgi:hypothetical protein
METKVQVFTKNEIFTIFPEEIYYLIFMALDLVSLFKVAQTCQKWQQLLKDSSPVWEGIYNHPNNQTILYHGLLWKVLFKQPEDSQPNSNIFLASYFKEVFNEEPENVADFLEGCFSDFFMGRKRYADEYSNTDLTRLCQYPMPWITHDKSTHRILKKLQKLFAQIQKWIKNGKVSCQLTKLDSIDYYPAVKLLLQLRQLEQLLTTVLIHYKMNTYYLDFTLYVAMLADSLCAHSLTAKGLLLLTLHDPILSPGYEYKIIKETTSEQATKVKKKYFECLKHWFSQAAEEELLEAFENSPEIILMEPAFLAHISDRRMLILASNVFATNVHMPFKNPEFVRRLKALPNAGDVLVGLTQGKVEFNGEIFQDSRDNKKWNERNFAELIILHPELTRCLTKDQLIILLPLPLTWFIKKAIVTNDNFATHIGCNYDLLVSVAQQIFNAEPILLAKHASVVGKLSGDTCANLALTNEQTALKVLEDEQLFLPLKPAHFARLREKYSAVKINHLIQQRQEEWLKREKAAVLTKTALELYELALSQEELSEYAAECLAGRSTLSNKLSKIKLIRLFNHYHPFEKLCCTNPEKPLFAEPLLAILASQPVEALFSLASGKEPIAYLAAKCLADNQDRLKLSIGQLRSLVQHYQKLAPHAPFVRVFKEKLHAITNTMNDLIKPHADRIPPSLVEKQKSDFMARRSKLPSLLITHVSKRSPYVPLAKKPLPSPSFKELKESLHPAPHYDSSERKATFRQEEPEVLPNHYSAPVSPPSLRKKYSLARIIALVLLGLLALSSLLCFASGVGAFAGLGFMVATLTAINVLNISLHAIAAILLAASTFTFFSSIGGFNYLKKTSKPQLILDPISIPPKYRQAKTMPCILCPPFCFLKLLKNYQLKEDPKPISISHSDEPRFKKSKI